MNKTNVSVCSLFFFFSSLLRTVARLKRKKKFGGALFIERTLPKCLCRAPTRVVYLRGAKVNSPCWLALCMSARPKGHTFQAQMCSYQPLWLLLLLKLCRPPFG